MSQGPKSKVFDGSKLVYVGSLLIVCGLGLKLANSQLPDATDFLVLFSRRVANPALGIGVLVVCVGVVLRLRP